MGFRWRWMPAGERSLPAIPPPTPSTRSCALSRQHGPTKRGLKGTEYRRSAIPTRVGSSTRRYRPNRAACVANRGLKQQVSGMGLGHETADVLGRGNDQVQILMPEA